MGCCFSSQNKYSPLPQSEPDMSRSELRRYDFMAESIDQVIKEIEIR